MSEKKFINLEKDLEYVDDYVVFNAFPERILLPQACEGRSPTIGGR
ncbi:hypothetical protein QUG02_27150 [Bacillus hominis]|uniref:Uncharacterized protein n=1 Tax=Bacillus hominis TaxID=2817478 RepID=A0ABT7RFL5_9BACI|nr:hypothetical protein [Bacillus hominis]MDM5191306.1 hypothetical protein [Bacillus hominis]MDM5436339.1 hypothetical protein [Bacillus hominis]MDM5441705.1 hypothetical protein [Bacillus hominis]